MTENTSHTSVENPRASVKTSHTSVKTSHTSGYDSYADIAEASRLLRRNWDRVGRTDKYSTGLPLLDEYMGSGFGIEGAGEVILIHSTSKTFKSTMSMQLMKTQLENGVKVGWIILEGGYWRALRNLRQLYAPVQIGDKVFGYERYDALEPILPQLIFGMTEEMQQNDFSMSEVIAWMKKTRLEKGVELFLIDPVGYLSDYSSDWNIPDYKKESKFMKDLVHFADSTCSTVICLQHNTKGNEGTMTRSHHEQAIGGSQSFSKSPTKVIEMRNEGWLNDRATEGRVLSFEMYMARDVQDWRNHPVLIDINFHPDGKGKFFSMRKYDEEEAQNRLREEGGKENRLLWYKQLKTDMDELLEMERL